MKRILHRCNDLVQVMRGFDVYDGVEIDVRRYNGTDEGGLALSHDPGHGGWALADFLMQWQGAAPHKDVFLNVKEFGLADALRAALPKVPPNLYIFDYPGCDIGAYHYWGLPVLARLSEFETTVPKAAVGVLIDAMVSSRNQSLLVDGYANGVSSRLIPAQTQDVVAMISNLCHSRQDYNFTRGPVTHLIGKASELEAV